MCSLGSARCSFTCFLESGQYYCPGHSLCGCCYACWPMCQALSESAVLCTNDKISIACSAQAG
ncbi:hypothetical protein BJV74DRAFT_839884 [Russula compacta]|nr:hypothetical protein BJV74DRAFT_839884 [Russula compacta]